MTNQGQTRTVTREAATIFVVGAIGGVALDILSLYFIGFPAPAGGQDVWWALGVAFRVIAFMTLTGILACLYANGQVRNAFIIGVAAPSILLNIAASVTRPKEPVQSIPSISAPTERPKKSFRTPSRMFSILGPALAEAQDMSLTPAVGVGQLKVTIGESQLDPAALKDGVLFILDESGRSVLAKTTPPSQSFVFSFFPGTYLIRFVGRRLQSPDKLVNIEHGRVNEVTLSVTPKTIHPWYRFWDGVGERIEYLAVMRRGGSA